MYENKVDPVRYAWEHCNPGVPFPSVLGQTGRGAFAVGLPNPLGVLALAQKAARAATPDSRAVHARIVGRRPHHKPRSAADRLSAVHAADSVPPLSSPS